VPGGFLGVNRQTVMGERVHDRRNEFGAWELACRAM
jgi:hypothetical protein